MASPAAIDRRLTSRMTTTLRGGCVRDGMEPTTMPPPGGRGGAPNAYRLSPRACTLLGYSQARRRETHLSHTLDAVEAVCALVRSAAPDTRAVPDTHPVQAWLTEPMARHVLGGDVHPDAVVVIQLHGRSAVMCIEIDEATEHMPGDSAQVAALRPKPPRSTGMASAANSPCAVARVVAGSGCSPGALCRPHRANVGRRAGCAPSAQARRLDVSAHQP
jgi:hypothetical protein